MADLIKDSQGQIVPQMFNGTGYEVLKGSDGAYYVKIIAPLAPGTNNIGKVDVASLPEGTKLIGQVKVTDGINALLINEHGSLKLVPYNSSGDELFTSSNPGNVTVSPSVIEEQKTEADAVNGVLTFAENIVKIGIYNMDSVDGQFIVNSLIITVPSGKEFEATVGGTPGTTVSVSGSTSYIVSRYS